MTTRAARAPRRPSRAARGGPAGLAARQAAVSLLGDVLDEGKPLDAAFLHQIVRGNLGPLEPRDRALARAIVATALRRKGQIDALLGRMLERPLPKSSKTLGHILAAALTQILFMQMPPHAVVNLAVEQTRGNRASRRFDKLTNAVLRRAVREGGAMIAAQDAARLNTPDWLWRRWEANYGEATAKRIGEAHLNEPALDLSVKSEPALWAEQLEAIELSTGSIRLRPKGRIEDLAGYGAGAWWVQDAAAALPVKLLGDVAGKRIADLCAAPGGKTAQLANLGANVTAVDTSKIRLARTAENLMRLELTAELVKADATKWQSDTPFDAILLDVPCMATGTIRRHPDIPYLKQERDLLELTRLQDALLANAVKLIKPGGSLIYCTCSMEPEEGEQRIAALLESEPGLRADPIEATEFAGEPGWITDQGYLRTLPFQCQTADPLMSGIDGFFAARLIIS